VAEQSEVLRNLTISGENFKLASIFPIHQSNPIMKYNRFWQRTFFATNNRIVQTVFENKGKEEQPLTRLSPVKADIDK
jgi:hypothetical protein